jgi:hypothetical protein
MVTSAITAADEAFTVLSAQPSPLAFDARGIPGLPARHLDLMDLRSRVAGRGPGTAVLPEESVDVVWRRLAVQARTWGPAWVVAAVGVAVPGLNRIATRLSVGFPRLSEDIDSEVVAGFLHALRTDDLLAPRVWIRLLWAAWRCGDRIRHDRETVELPLDLASGSSSPHAPYGHPDLLLGRAVALGVLTPEAAALIGDTRIGDTLIDQLAAEQGVSAPVLRMRRHRAEQALVRALRRGDLSGLGAGVPSGRDQLTQAHIDGFATAPAYRPAKGR